MAETQLIAAEKLCTLTGVSDKRHRQIAKEGFFPPPINGQYQMALTLQGLFRYYRELGKRKHSTFESERTKKLAAERRIEELKLARMLGNSLDAEAVVRAWQNCIMVARQKLLALESKVSGRLGFDEHQQQELRKEIEEALAELSKPQKYEQIGEEEIDEGLGEGGEALATTAKNERG